MEVVYLTVMMTCANHFFMFLQSVLHGLHQHGQLTETGFLPSLVHPDVGEVDLAFHVRVPAVVFQSYASYDDPSDLAAHAAAVSSQRSSVVLEIRCVMSLWFR